ncbi:distal membrane-arm assembly complex protein 2-like [Oppia nitens]|uniref:distal membrane-arm assembly complex protein 2-like n=1 Tax=Oppia nitens TaxID=1686743 RepID=UPI0023DB5C12|nr:distal membrane-arm assembly complex protein 2-like [Oppia nitens]
MFRHSINSFIYRSLLTPNCCYFSSQIAKTNVNLVKSDFKQQQQQELSVKTETNELTTTQETNVLSEEDKRALAMVIKSPVDLDTYWEMALKEKKFVKKQTILDKKGGISTDLLKFLHHKYDISIPGIKRRLRYYIEFREIYNQRYINRRHTIIGPELATAHLVVYRGGRVQFRHAPNVWYTKCKQFPNIYDERYRLTVVDASNIKLRYEALDNFILLNSLQELNLSKNKHLDDFACDKIARLFRNSKNLTTLDLSDNPLITSRGIETLHRIRSLKKLIISRTKAANYPFIDLLIILFTDVNPNCEIIIK